VPKSDHVIYRQCISRGFNTRNKPNGYREGLGYVCPACHTPNFHITCSFCKFESSEDCPLTQLLAWKSEEEPINSPLRASTPFRFDENDSSEQPSTPIELKKGQQNEDTKDSSALEENSTIFGTSAPESMNTCEISPNLEEEQGGGLEIVSEKEPSPPLLSPAAPQVSCEQCTQPLCPTCPSGYINLIVDMADFPVSFASEIRLCTMCKHWKCPKSKVVVLFRCRECGHEGCEACFQLGKERGGEEEDWCVCCMCSRKNDPEMNPKESKGDVVGE
jgi:hypothetical protein